MCKHHKESDYLHGHGDPDRLYAKPGGAGGTESGTDRKNQNNKSTVHAFVFHRRIFADMVQAEIFGCTSHISDAHGCCTWNTAEFAEGIDLHGTGERKHDVRDHIEGIIAGYDQYNTILLKPGEAETYYYGLEESADMFEAAGNQFVTYFDPLEE